MYFSNAHKSFVEYLNIGQMNDMHTVYIDICFEWIVLASIWLYRGVPCDERGGKRAKRKKNGIFYTIQVHFSNWAALIAQLVSLHSNRFKHLMTVLNCIIFFLSLFSSYNCQAIYFSTYFFFGSRSRTLLNSHKFFFFSNNWECKHSEYVAFELILCEMVYIFVFFVYFCTSIGCKSWDEVGVDVIFCSINFCSTFQMNYFIQNHLWINYQVY